ncbi:MAG: hypothetical protein LBE09_02075 [Christensenellaceae bacterium]|nr:hypothetical protein [Christensenellaceae bacterium]
MRSTSTQTDAMDTLHVTSSVTQTTFVSQRRKVLYIANVSSKTAAGLWEYSIDIPGKPRICLTEMFSKSFCRLAMSIRLMPK